MNTTSREDRPLDVGTEAAARLLSVSTDAVTRHAELVPDGPVAPPRTGRDEILEWLRRFDFAEPRDADDLIPEVTAMLRRWGVHTTHPRYLGLFNPTPTWWGVAGELITAAVNPQLGAYSHAPAANEIERHVVRAVAGWLGLPDESSGTFTSGGSEANLTATVVALTRTFPDYPQHGVRALPGRPVLYASAESHLAWLKIAHATGLGREAVRLVPVDAAHRMDLAALDRMRAADVAAGHRPFLLAATAGTTGGGAVDPLPELAARSADWGAHFHVDAAWAGAAALSDRLRPILSGIELADSVTMDAHKWLSAPMGAGMFVTPHRAAMGGSFQVNTSYMPADDASGDPYTSGLQWSRRFIGLKVFLALAAAGRDGFAAQLERDVDLGHRLAGRLVDDGWTRINEGPLPVVCVADPAAEAAGSQASLDWHTAVADAVVRGGSAWISVVRLAGRPGLRMCITSHRTTAGDIDAVAEAVRAARKTVPLP